MQRIFAIFLICLLQFQVITTTAFAGDSTSFNPVPITVTAKGAGGVPVGTIIAWPVAQNPSDMENWLECNGQSVSRSVYPELFAVVGGRVPDFRGEFLRGYDAGRGGDSGRSIGSSQGEDVGTHTHEVYLSGSGTANKNVNRAAASENFHTATIDRTGPGGGDETRPRNIAVRYLIRAVQ